jgi:transcription elongation factor Elf1
MSTMAYPTRDSSKRIKIGITCPGCGAKTRVYYTRPVDVGKVQRVTICNECAQRITTHEVVVGAGTGEKHPGIR